MGKFFFVRDGSLIAALYLRIASVCWWRSVVALPLHPRKRNKECIKQKIDTMEKKYYCTVCDWVYDPAVGDPDGGIAPGTPFEDIPDDWACPLCGVTKEDFVIVEE